MKFFTLLFLTFVSAGIARAQEAPCKLKVAPEVRGFRLGMSPEQVKAKLKFVVGSEKPDEIGVATFFVGPISLADEKAGQGLSTISFEFLDNRLTYIEVNYDSSVKWDNVEQFTSALSESLNLPDKWGSPITTSQDVLGVHVTAAGRKLECAGFNAGAIVTSVNTSTLMIGQAGLKAEKDRRRNAIQKSQQQTFKP
jgi:hypothetical protein